MLCWQVYELPSVIVGFVTEQAARCVTENRHASEVWCPDIHCKINLA